MVKSILCGLLLSAFAPQLTAAEAGNDKDTPQVIVRIYNYAGVGEDFLPRAQQEAAGIFLEVGIRLSWLSCTPTHEGIVEEPLCHQSAPNVVSLMICPEAMLPRGGLPRGIFGFALMPQPGEPARYARLYFHRLAELADGRKVRRGVLLGAMMAHEIGHLLLGVNSHSREGIMSIPWDARKLQEVDRGQLAFTAEQASTLRAEGQAWASLTVRIYDYAKLSSGYLNRAAEKARHVYRQVGIETRWIQCRVSLEEPVKNPACEAEPGPTVLQMKILSKVMAERFGLEGEVFGFALPPREGGFGNVASIFHHRVQGLAASSATPPEVILGHILAHEAGHLLLGINGHSSRGIMHIPWRNDDLQRAEVGGLKFTRQQAERMRKQVQQRWEVLPQGDAAVVRSDSRTHSRTM